MLDDQHTIEGALESEGEPPAGKDTARGILTVGDHAAWLEDHAGLGWLVLGELHRSFGWCVAVMAPFAGAIDDQGTAGIMISLTHPTLANIEIKVLGRSVDECVPQVLAEVDKLLPRFKTAPDRRPCGAGPATERDQRHDADRLAGSP